MASIALSDGRVIPIVKPHIGDQMELERQMKSLRKDYGPKQFQEDLKLTTFQTAFALFASFNRAGVATTIHEVFDLDLGELGQIMKFDKSESYADDDEPESEGEQTEDPQPPATVADAAEK